MENNEEKSIRGLFKLKSVGDSLYLLIDKKTKSYLGIEAEDYLLARLSTIQEKEVTCPKCKYKMVVLSNDEVYDCALCGNEFTLGQINEIQDKQPGDDKDLNEGNEDEPGSLQGGTKKDD